MRSTTITTALAASLGAVLLCIAPVSATATPSLAVAAPFIAPTEDAPVTPVPVMGEYNADDYEDAAAELPDGLIDALADEGLTGAEYLAQSDAAADAGDVVSALEAQVDVVASRLEGTELIVTVASDADVPAVEESGAVAEVGAAPEPIAAPVAPEFMQELEGGEAYYYETGPGQGHRCSIGFNGFAISTGAPQFATAGHCNSGNNNYYFWLEQAQAGTTGYTLYSDAQIGRRVSSSFRLGGGYDFGLVNVDSSQAGAWEPISQVEYWSGQQGGFKNDDWSQFVNDRIPAVVGATLCKSGSTSGWTCGEVLDVDVSVNVAGQLTDSIVTDACIQSGDSGGAGLIGNAAVGIVSWAETAVPCGNANYISGLFSLVSTDSSAKSGLTGSPDWEPEVYVGAVTIDPSIVNNVMTGSLFWGGPRHVIDISFDNGASTVTVPVASNGTWSVPLPSLSPGTHSATAQPRWGTWSLGTPASKVFAVQGAEIRGNVDDNAGVDLAGVCVDAVSGANVVDTDTTTSGGNYILGPLAAGSYLVHFRDCTADARTFEDEWWDNADNAAGATATTVMPGQTVQNRNAALALAGPFADVRNNHAFATQINWMYSEGLSNGYVDGGVRTYHPVEDVSRQAMAAFLYRYSGSPDFTLPETPTFDDVPADHPFYREIEWMKFAGITNGNVGPNDTLLYLPLDAVSRQAMSAFLYRLAGNPEFTAPATATFTDVGVGSPFYLQVEWMKANAITNGYNDGGSFSFHPVEAVSRQAMAAFLSRYDGID